MTALAHLRNKTVKLPSLLLWTWLAVHALTERASAQGLFSAINNYVPRGGSEKAFVFGLDGKVLSKTVGRVAILTADFQYLSPGGEAGVPLTLDGLFFIRGLAVPGVPPGGSTTVAVQAWDSSTGTTFAEAWARGMVWVTLENLGGGDAPAATFFANSNFRGLWFGDLPLPPFGYQVEEGLATITSCTLRRQYLLIPDTVDGWTVGRIAPQVFAGRPELVDVWFPETLVEIGSGAFSGCQALREMTFPEGLRAIGVQAFANCTQFRVLRLPRSLTNLGTGAFAGCTQLQSLYFAGPAPETSGSLGLRPDAVVYHLPGQPGWSETWNGMTTRVWLPALTVRQNGTPLRWPILKVDWAEGQTVVVEGSERLEAPVWIGLSTNRLEGPSLIWTPAPDAGVSVQFFRVSVP